MSAAADEEKEENIMADNFDFIGFTYNGLHSYTNFHIYRTSDGSRYNQNLIPTLTDKTADVPGGDGQYYFTSFHKNRTFNINFAFDELREIDIRKLRNWLFGKEVGDLIFDEEPYKVYSAKVTGAPTLKALCFDEKGERIYKGEGSITFTCYYPYAHTPTVEKQGFDGRSFKNYTNKNRFQWKDASTLEGTHSIGMNKGDLPTPFIVTKTGSTQKGETFAIGDCKITIQEDCSNLQWNSKTGLVTGIVGTAKKSVKFLGTSYGTIPVEGIADPTKIYHSKDGYRICADKKRYKENDDGTTTLDPSNQTGTYELPFTIEYHYWYY